jgi:hypothetical protein
LRRLLLPIANGDSASHPASGRQGHYSHWETVDWQVVMESRIALNWYRLALQGAGLMDIHRVLERERAHARGWRPYEGTPEENAAYYPDIIRITGL